jgi:parallel beta-helix repeat protein
MISNNQVVNDGGGIQCHHSSPTITNNTITENTVGKSGGGAYFSGCYSSAITGNTISKNSADMYGGGIFNGYDLEFSISAFSNNVIAGNSASLLGGGFFFINNNSVMNNNTITDNSTMKRGGGICCHELSSTTVRNTILYDNSAQKGLEIYVGNASDLIISHSDVKGGQVSIYVDPNGTLNWGPDMIDADPLFNDPLNDDFHLSFASLCIDAGDNNVSLLPALDFEGDPRIFPGNGKGVYLVGSPSQAAIVDMGADEYCLLKKQKFISK